MSKRIELEQISENEIEVVLPPETPMEMVQQLVKGLNQRGLVEDLSKSTLSVRYFVRPTDKANTVADELIKSLSRLTKNDELPYWHPKSQFANQKRVREMEIAERRAKNGVKQPTNVTTTPEPLVAPDAAPKTPAPAATTATANTLTPQKYTAPHPKMVDTTPGAMNTAGGTGKRYAYINDPVAKQEDDEDDVEKSNYGPKGAGLYNPNDNAKRKANNTGDQTGFGSNVNTKQYTTAKFGNKDVQSTPAQKRPGPVKSLKDGTLNPSVVEEIKARANKLKKSTWGQHLPFPSAEEEIMKLAKSKPLQGEEASAQQLANLMAGKNMLGQKVHPAVAAMMAPPPPQPTDEEMFGHLVVSEEMAKKADAQWGNTFNNWLTEASKPISQRFASEEEELAYWRNIKVEDRDDGKSGY